jgi:pilus assembly protein Flp/PilA
MPMRALYALLVVQLDRLRDESGQDLVEYALIVAMIAFAAIMGMNDLANGINTAFNTVAQTVNQYL